MTDDAVAIRRLGPDDGDSAYSRLRAAAIRHVRAMSGDVWTDFNHSDPGVTILEQLCYALTELPHRASLPIATLLAGPPGEGVPLRRQGLVPAPAILTCNPVTPRHLRRIVLDRVEGVANIWFDPVTSGPDIGLYDVTVMPMGDVARDDAVLIDRVLACYHAHRALCEDVRSVRILTLVDTYVHAVVELQDATDPAQALAAALFRLGLYLAPEPRRSSLDAQRRRSTTTADLFDGPRMLRGFIPDAQLADLPSPPTVDDLRRCIEATPGIATASGIAVEVSGHSGRFTGGDRLARAEHGIFWLRGTTQERAFTIRLQHHGVEVQPNPARVRRLLDAMWRDQRRTYPMRQAYGEMFGAPRGDPVDLVRYDPVRDQFPAVYGIGENGLPADASPTRRRQALQLAGYLVPFDQLLADHVAQVADIRELFSVDGATASVGGVYRSLRDVLSDADDLLAANYEDRLASLAEESGLPVQRRAAAIDLLLSLYGRRPMVSQEKATDARQRLLKGIEGLGRNRGRGANYRRSRSPTNISGLESLIRIELDLADAAPVLAQPTPTDPGIDRVWREADDPIQEGFGRRLPDAWFPVMERHFGHVPPLEDQSPPAPSPRAGRQVEEPLAAALGDASRYRIGRLDDGERIYVLCVDRDGGWWWLGEHLGRDEALDAIRAILADARVERPASPPRFTLVEWPLLRAGRRAGDPDFAMRATAMISATRVGWVDTVWQREVTTRLHAAAPAHIALDCRFVGDATMTRFDALHREWAEAMFGDHPGRQAATAAALVAFLDPREPPPVPPPPRSPVAPTPAPEAEPEPSHLPAIEAAALEPIAPLSPPAAPSPPPLLLDAPLVAPSNLSRKWSAELCEAMLLPFQIVFGRWRSLDRHDAAVRWFNWR